MTRWNGKPDLTASQVQERKRRRILDRRMRFGMPTPKGTKPRCYTRIKPEAEAVAISLFDRLSALLPWVLFRRKRQERRSKENDNFNLVRPR